MNIKKLITGFCTLLLLFYMCGCSTHNNLKDIEVTDITVGSSITSDASEAPIESTVPSTVSEDDTIYACGYADRLKGYETMDELVSFSENAFYGRVISSIPVFQNEMLYTLSQVEVKKGMQLSVCNLKNVLICEQGVKFHFVCVLPSSFCV